MAEQGEKAAQEEAGGRDEAAGGPTPYETTQTGTMLAEGPPAAEARAGADEGAGEVTDAGCTSTAEAAPDPLAASDYEVAALTDRGAVRLHNEDSVEACILAPAAEEGQPPLLCLVADGMGGHQAGEVASREAVQRVVEELRAHPGEDPGDALVRAYHVANRAIHQQAQADPEKAGMGTTLVGALIVGPNTYLANVGDSRAYLIDSHGAVQITEDHSWVEEQVRAGLLTPEQAHSHPQRNLVTRALGSRPEVEVDLYEGTIDAGETLLLCSDGLSNELADDEIAEIVLAHPPQEAAALLVAKANEHGGNDNVSVVIARSRQTEWAPQVPESHEGRLGRAPALPFLLALFLILALVAVGLFVVPRLLNVGP